MPKGVWSSRVLVDLRAQVVGGWVGFRLVWNTAVRVGWLSALDDGAPLGLGTINNLTLSCFAILSLVIER